MSSKYHLYISLRQLENELQTITNNIEQLHSYLERDELPPIAQNIDRHLVTGQRGVSMAALTCRYHALCTGNPQWYEDALYEAARVVVEPDASVPM